MTDCLKYTQAVNVKKSKRTVKAKCALKCSFLLGSLFSSAVSGKKTNTPHPDHLAMN